MLGLVIRLVLVIRVYGLVVRSIDLVISLAYMFDLVVSLVWFFNQFGLFVSLVWLFDQFGLVYIVII